MMRIKMTNRSGSGSGAGLVRGLLPAAFLLLLGALPAPAQTEAAAPADFDYEAQPLRIGVWVDKDGEDVYKRGEDLQVAFQANEDAYAVVYRIDAEGLVSVLWPRSRFDDGFVFGGHEYQLPVTGGPRLKVADSEGMGYVEALVSSYPFDLRALEIDFHHETGDKRYDFLVAGDPFLAINEINFAVTGLEDSAALVATNYASYYVHQKVDHPRYLCSQCHFDEPVAYHPYRDHCSLNISFDYGWGNDWYLHYGYYPVYWNPVYTYYDPWTWRPWVNFWYYPSYRCAPYWRSWDYHTYVWCDSPYYRGDSLVRYKEGNCVYRPLVLKTEVSSLRRSSDYLKVTTRLDRRPLEVRTRTAMKDRSVVRDADRNVARVGAKPRTRTAIEKRSDSALNPGLRVRDERTVREQSRTTIRHQAGGGTVRPRVETVTPGVSRSREAEPAVRGKTSVSPRGQTEPRTIKPVEPRKREPRLWKSGADKDRQPATRSGSAVRPQTVRPERRTQEADRTRSATDRSKGSGRDEKATNPRSGSDDRGGSAAGRSKSAGDGGKAANPRSGAQSGSSKSGSSKSGNSKSGNNSGGGSSSKSGGSRSGGGR